MISSRLVENLRRKNEALKQAAKRERSDPMATLVPSVSPTCLNDDSVSLRLLVKLGKTQEAAIAYSARRSLLLLERYVLHPFFERYYCTVWSHLFLKFCHSLAIVFTNDRFREREMWIWSFMRHN